MYAQIWKSPKNGLWYWHVRSANHEIISQSQGYHSKEAAIHGLRLTFAGPCYDL